ncbi:alpha/beta fold hydrolase [Cohnella sp. REN36]|uniref:alpha/beta fold hydrolase n=1 Tax=Cohnella sp. REN36 TaxID=2887347 RepID=UPI001D1532E5|nr:alpha/beta hydrolase [Cohnella sp. REN36]MCC3372726.1 alpha/beta hydrolase [Cohnella sp. REN36]
MVELLYGMDLPLLVVMLILWGGAGIAAGQLVYVVAPDRLRRQAGAIRTVSYLAMGLAVICMAVLAADLSWYSDPDEMGLHLALLLVPAVFTVLFSFPKLSKVRRAASTPLEADPKGRDLRLLCADPWMIVPMQAAACCTGLSLYYLLVPHARLKASNLVFPLAILIMLTVVLGYRWYRRQQAYTGPDARLPNRQRHIAEMAIGLSLFLVWIIATVGLTNMTSGETNRPEGEEHVQSVPSRQSEVHTGRVTTEGDEIYYEVRGQGKPLLMISGGGGDAGFYSLAADILSDEYQVITYDRRGNSRSTRNDPQNFEISQQARDAVAVLKAAGHTSAYVFGNSGGAIIALEMATSQPEAVKAVIAHEPPVLRVLPDSEKWLRFFADLYRTAYKYGTTVANLKFSLSLSIPLRAYSSIPGDFSKRSSQNQQFFMKQEMLPFSGYQPDVETIKRNGVKVFMAAGKMTLDKKKYYGRTAAILADRLGTDTIRFPGHHLSYFDMPEEWAAVLRDTLHKAASEVNERFFDQ